MKQNSINSIYPSYSSPSLTSASLNPSLASSSIWQQIFNKKMLLIMLMGFYSGLPLALSCSTIQAWFASEKISIITIGYLSLLNQPYAYKFLWAPILDKIIPPVFGRRTGWILIFQILLVLCISLVGFCNITNHIYLIMLLGLGISVFSASQDIVFDAYKIDILSQPERGLGVAMGVEGYRIAMLISGGGALILADKLGWQSTYLVMAAIMATGLLVTSLAALSKKARFLENRGQAPATWGRAIKDPLMDFLKRDKAFYIIIFIILFKLGDSYNLVLSTPFLLKELQFTLTEIGVLNKILGLVASLVGVFVGGLILTRIKLYYGLIFFCILQCASSFSYVLLAIFDKNFMLAANAIFIEYLCGGMGTAALCAFIMNLCNKNFSALQFSLLSSVATISRIFVGPSAGYLVIKLGWPVYFALSALLSLPALIVLLFLKPIFNAKNQEQTAQY